MKTLMERLQSEEDKLNLELEESHGDYEKMKMVFEKRIDLYKRFLKEESLTEVDRLRLENKKEWTMSHMSLWYY
jgi:shikimate kinase